MNAIEIFGSLLGRKSGDGAGADILSEILVGKRLQSPQTPQGGGQGAPSSDAMDAKSLEDLT